MQTLIIVLQSNVSEDVKKKYRNTTFKCEFKRLRTNELVLPTTWLRVTMAVIVIMWRITVYRYINTSHYVCLKNRVSVVHSDRTRSTTRRGGELQIRIKHSPRTLIVILPSPKPIPVNVFQFFCQQTYTYRKHFENVTD